MIAEATHNPVLALTVDYVEDFLLSFKKSNLLPDIQFTTRTINDHRKIYTALKRRDASVAEQEMLNHCRFVEEYLSTRENPARK